MGKIVESLIEEFVIDLLEAQGYEYLSPEQQEAERADLSEVVLKNRLVKAVEMLNSSIPADAREQAVRQIINLPTQNLMDNNEAVHQMLTDGIPVEYMKDEEVKYDEVKLIDYQEPRNNEFLVCNQFTVMPLGQVLIERGDANPLAKKDYEGSKRPDIVILINGLPIVVIELKNPADEQATVYKAFTQLQNYMTAVPSLFNYSGVLIASDGLDARAGTISSEYSRFLAWKSVDGFMEDKTTTPQIETLVKGMLNKQVLLDLIRHFVVYERSSVTTPALSPSQREGGNYRGGMHFTGLIEQIRELRKNQTEAEAIFWSVVRNKQFLGLKFRRQHQIGHYVVDFYCPSEKLVIELDGEIHRQANQSKKDAVRDNYLTSLGNKIIRFQNDDLFNDPQALFQRIEKSISPSGRDGREGGFETTKTFHEKGFITIKTIKKIAAYHQYFAVNKAIESTLRAVSFQGAVELPEVGREDPGRYGLESTKSQPVGDRRAGVIWHTQGSGKSLIMVFYAGKIVLALDNPTIVVITDRNDLDDQLFDTFTGSKQLLRQEPVQAKNREDLKKRLKVAGGGIVFTTIQKFFPEDESETFDMLSARENIVVIADEAHRSQYGFAAKTVYDKDGKGARTSYGFAKYLRDALPHASFIGFTGTPIEKEDASTPAVFGNYIDVYDIARAVEDGATVRIYYESRLAKVHLNQDAKEKLDQEVEAITETEESFATEKAKAKWAQLEAIVGDKDRLSDVAADIMDHFEKRTEAFEGKAMIVTMSRRIAVELYDEIVKLRPQWQSEDKTKGAIKVIMTSSSSDPGSWQPHNTSKEDRRALGERFKNPSDPLKIVIVRDMWLTGFDVPCLHTMYIDKPMRGHTLMQAIARVNRVFKDKPGGLVVDYIGIASDLKKALATYTENGGQGAPTLDQEEAVAVMLEKYEIVAQMFDSFSYEGYLSADTQQKLTLILEAQEYILGLEDGKNRFVKQVGLLSKAFALSVPHLRAMELKEVVGFFQAVKARLVKFESSGNGRPYEEIETAIKQIVDRAVVSEGIVDVFDAAGIKKPDISILSDEFLAEIQGMEKKNIALELLKKILNDEIKTRSRKNMMQSKKMSEMLENAIRKYQNNLLTTAQVIEELIRLAKDIKQADRRGEELNLSDDEIAFYDALANNDSAIKIMGDESLRDLARVLVEKVKSKTSIDWTIKENVQAKLRVIVKRTLKKFGYPPDQQLLATENILKQAALLADEWAVV